MTWRTFGQSLVLIVFAGFVYWAANAVLNWQARRAFEAHALAPASVEADQQLRGNDVLTVDATNTTAPAEPGDTRDNIIDGQVVHKKDGHWVTDDGRVLKAAD